MNGQTKNAKLMPCIIGAVALIGFSVSVVTLIWRLTQNLPDILFIWICVYYGSVLYYGVKGYKKPHGNLVRYIMLIQAIYVAYTDASLFLPIQGA